MPIPADYTAIVKDAQQLVKKQLQDETPHDKAHFVAWESSQMQYQQFDQLIDMVSPVLDQFQDKNQQVRILDYGCGQGDLLTYLNSQLEPDQFTYIGVDILDEMIDQAKKLFSARGNATQFYLIKSEEPFDAIETILGYKFDVVIASGIFSILVDQTDILAFMDAFKEATVVTLNAFAHGFSTPVNLRDKHYPIYSMYNPVLLRDYLERNSDTESRVDLMVFDKCMALPIGPTTAADGDTIVVARYIKQ